MGEKGEPSIQDVALQKVCNISKTQVLSALDAAVEKVLLQVIKNIEKREVC